MPNLKGGKNQAKNNETLKGGYVESKTKKLPFLELEELPGYYLGPSHATPTSVKVQNSHLMPPRTSFLKSKKDIDQTIQSIPSQTRSPKYHSMLEKLSILTRDRLSPKDSDWNGRKIRVTPRLTTNKDAFN